MTDIPHDDRTCPGTEAALLDSANAAELAFERAQRDGTPFVLLCVEINDSEQLFPVREQRQALVQAVLEIATALPRERELYAWHAGARLYAALPAATPPAANAWGQAWIDAARRIDLPRAERHVRASLSIGLASTQAEMNLWFDVLARVAEEGVAVSAARGSECVTHTELYDLHLNRLERERGPHVTRLDIPSAAPIVATTTVPVALDPEAAREARLDAAIGATMRTAPPALELQRRMVEYARNHAREATHQALGEQALQHAAHVQVYERRLEKLQVKLDETEATLGVYVEAAQREPGIPSDYRFVQGLSENENRVEVKRTILAGLRQHNLELREKLGKTG